MASEGGGETCQVRRKSLFQKTRRHKKSSEDKCQPACEIKAKPAAVASTASSSAAEAATAERSQQPGDTSIFLGLNKRNMKGPDTTKTKTSKSETKKTTTKEKTPGTKRKTKKRATRATESEVEMRYRSAVAEAAAKAAVASQERMQRERDYMTDGEGGSMRGGGGGGRHWRPWRYQCGFDQTVLTEGVRRVRSGGDDPCRPSNTDLLLVQDEDRWNRKRVLFPILKSGWRLCGRSRLRDESEGELVTCSMAASHASSCVRPWKTCSVAALVLPLPPPAPCPPDTARTSGGAFLSSSHMWSLAKERENPSDIDGFSRTGLRALLALNTTRKKAGGCRAAGSKVSSPAKGAKASSSERFDHSHGALDVMTSHELRGTNNKGDNSRVSSGSGTIDYSSAESGFAVKAGHARTSLLSSSSATPVLKKQQHRSPTLKVSSKSKSSKIPLVTPKAVIQNQCQSSSVRGVLKKGRALRRRSFGHVILATKKTSTNAQTASMSGSTAKAAPAIPVTTSASAGESPSQGAVDTRSAASGMPTDAETAQLSAHSKTETLSTPLMMVIPKPTEGKEIEPLPACDTSSDSSAMFTVADTSQIAPFSKTDSVSKPLMPKPTEGRELRLQPMGACDTRSEASAMPRHPDTAEHSTNLRTEKLSKPVMPKPTKGIETESHSVRGAFDTMPQTTYGIETEPRSMGGAFETRSLMPKLTKGRETEPHLMEGAFVTKSLMPKLTKGIETEPHSMGGSFDMKSLMPKPTKCCDTQFYSKVGAFVAMSPMPKPTKSNETQSHSMGALRARHRMPKSAKTRETEPHSMEGSFDARSLMPNATKGIETEPHSREGAFGAKSLILNATTGIETESHSIGGAFNTKSLMPEPTESSDKQSHSMEGAFDTKSLMPKLTKGIDTEPHSMGGAFDTRSLMPKPIKSRETEPHSMGGATKGKDSIATWEVVSETVPGEDKSQFRLRRLTKSPPTTGVKADETGPQVRSLDDTSTGASSMSSVIRGKQSRQTGADHTDGCPGSEMNMQRKPRRNSVSGQRKATSPAKKGPDRSMSEIFRSMRQKGCLVNNCKRCGGFVENGPLASNLSGKDSSARSRKSLAKASSSRRGKKDARSSPSKETSPRNKDDVTSAVPEFETDPRRIQMQITTLLESTRHSPPTAPTYTKEGLDFHFLDSQAYRQIQQELQHRQYSHAGLHKIGARATVHANPQGSGRHSNDPELGPTRRDAKGVAAHESHPEPPGASQRGGAEGSPQCCPSDKEKGRPALPRRRGSPQKSRRRKLSGHKIREPHHHHPQQAFHDASNPTFNCSNNMALNEGDALRNVGHEPGNPPKSPVSTPGQNVFSWKQETGFRQLGVAHGHERAVMDREPRAAVVRGRRPVSRPTPLEATQWRRGVKTDDSRTLKKSVFVTPLPLEAKGSVFKTRFPVLRGPTAKCGSSEAAAGEGVGSGFGSRAGAGTGAGVGEEAEAGTGTGGEPPNVGAEPMHLPTPKPDSELQSSWAKNGQQVPPPRFHSKQKQLSDRSNSVKCRCRPVLFAELSSFPPQMQSRSLAAAPRASSHYEEGDLSDRVPAGDWPGETNITVAALLSANLLTPRYLVTLADDASTTPTNPTTEKDCSATGGPARWRCGAAASSSSHDTQREGGVRPPPPSPRSDDDTFHDDSRPSSKKAKLSSSHRVGSGVRCVPLWEDKRQNQTGNNYNALAWDADSNADIISLHASATTIDDRESGKKGRSQASRAPAAQFVATLEKAGTEYGQKRALEDLQYIVSKASPRVPDQHPATTSEKSREESGQKGNTSTVTQDKEDDVARTTIPSVIHKVDNNALFSNRAAVQPLANGDTSSCINTAPEKQVKGENVPVTKTYQLKQDQIDDVPCSTTATENRVKEGSGHSTNTATEKHDTEDGIHRVITSEGGQAKEDCVVKLQGPFLPTLALSHWAQSPSTYDDALCSIRPGPAREPNTGAQNMPSANTAQEKRDEGDHVRRTQTHTAKQGKEHNVPCSYTSKVKLQDEKNCVSLGPLGGHPLPTSALSHWPATEPGSGTENVPSANAATEKRDKGVCRTKSYEVKQDKEHNISRSQTSKVKHDQEYRVSLKTLRGHSLPTLGLSYWVQSTSTYDDALCRNRPRPAIELGSGAQNVPSANTAQEKRDKGDYVRCTKTHKAKQDKEHIVPRSQTFKVKQDEESCASLGTLRGHSLTTSALSHWPATEPGSDAENVPSANAATEKRDKGVCRKLKQDKEHNVPRSHSSKMKQDQEDCVSLGTLRGHSLPTNVNENVPSANAATEKQVNGDYVRRTNTSKQNQEDCVSGINTTMVERVKKDYVPRSNTATLKQHKEDYVPRTTTAAQKQDQGDDIYCTIASKVKQNTGDNVPFADIVQPGTVSTNIRKAAVRRAKLLSSQQLRPLGYQPSNELNDRPRTCNYAGTVKHDTWVAPLSSANKTTVKEYKEVTCFTRTNNTATAKEYKEVTHWTSTDNTAMVKEYNTVIRLIRTQTATVHEFKKDTHSTHSTSTSAATENLDCSSVSVLGNQPVSLGHQVEGKPESLLGRFLPSSARGPERNQWWRKQRGAHTDTDTPKHSFNNHPKSAIPRN